MGVAIGVALALGACSDAGKGGSAAGGAAPGAALGEAEMKAAVAEALATHDLLDRVSALVDLMRRLDAGNVAGAADAYEAAARGIDPQDAALFANAWARLDYEAAMDRFLTIPNPAVQFRGIAEVIFQRARSGDAEAVRAYAERTVLGNADLPTADLESAAAIIVDATARGLAAAGEFEELNALLELLESGQARSFLITKTMIELGRNDGDIRAWADGIPWDAKNDLKKDVLRPVLAVIASSDGRQASEWYDGIKDKLEPGLWLGEIGDAWAGTDPVAALEWLLAQPPSEPRSMALRTGAYAYLRRDGAAAADWIKARLDRPDVHAHMLFPLVQYVISVDIQQALPLAREIEGEGDRNAALKQILMIWSRSDYDAVKKYMAEQGVSPEVEEAVIGQNEIRIQRRRAKEAADAAAAGRG